MENAITVPLTENIGLLRFVRGRRTLHDSDGFQPFRVYPAPWLDSVDGVRSEPVPDVVEAGSEP